MALSVQAQLNGDSENQVADSDSQVCLCLNQLAISFISYRKLPRKSYRLVCIMQYAPFDIPVYILEVTCFIL